MAKREFEVTQSVRRSSEIGLDSLTSVRFSEISVPRQALIRLCQLTNFGEIRDIEVRGREPIFGSASAVLVDVRLDADEVTRPESVLPDFTLRQELRRFLSQIDQIETGRINRIEIRAGLPRRMLFEVSVRRLLR